MKRFLELANSRIGVAAQQGLRFFAFFELFAVAGTLLRDLALGIPPRPISFWLDLLIACGGGSAIIGIATFVYWAWLKSPEASKR